MDILGFALTAVGWDPTVLPSGDLIQGDETCRGGMGTSYRHEEHGEEVNHGFHVEAPLGRDADGGEEDQGADGGQKELGHQ